MSWGDFSDDTLRAKPEELGRLSDLLVPTHNTVSHSHSSGEFDADNDNGGNGKDHNDSDDGHDDDDDDNALVYRPDTVEEELDILFNKRRFFVIDGDRMMLDGMEAVFVDTGEKLTAIIQQIQRFSPASRIFVDLEGHGLGANPGSLSLINIFVEGISAIFCFDILSLKEKAFGGGSSNANADGSGDKYTLTTLFSSPHTLVMFDPRTDCLALWSQFRVQLTADVICCQLLYMSITMHSMGVRMAQSGQGVFRPSFLAVVLDSPMISATHKAIFELVKGAFNTDDDFARFSARPLDKACILYSCNDVYFLPLVFRELLVEVDSDVRDTHLLRIIAETRKCLQQIYDYKEESVMDVRQVLRIPRSLFADAAPPSKYRQMLEAKRIEELLRDTVCFNCKRSGHVRQQCDFPIQRKAAGVCFVCSNPGHVARDCPTISGGGGDGENSAVTVQSRMVYVGNLPHSCNEAMLRRRLDKYAVGEIVDCRMLGGYAFLTFASADGARAVVDGYASREERRIPTTRAVRAEEDGNMRQVGDDRDDAEEAEEDETEELASGRLIVELARSRPHRNSSNAKSASSVPAGLADAAGRRTRKRESRWRDMQKFERYLDMPLATDNDDAK